MKQGIRADGFWTSGIVYRSPLRLIPFWLDMSALASSERWSAEERDRYHVKRRSSAVARAKRLTFWREHLKVVADNSLVEDDSWKSIPITSKVDFAGRNENEFVDQSLRGASVFDHTSGSTGRPFNFYFDRGAELRSFAVTERMVCEVGGETRYPLVYMRSRYRQGFTFYKHVQFFIRGFTSVSIRLAELQKFTKQYVDGFILYGYTSSIIEVARQMEEQKITLPLKAVMATGESLTEAARNDIERITKVPFRMAYASRETGWLAHECMHKKFHLNEAWALVEIVNDSNDVCRIGEEGRIIVTTFDNEVQPFIRYEIGDRGKFTGEACSCGRGGRVIALRGRQSEIIAFKSGFRTSLLELLAALDAHAGAVRRFQIVRTNELSFEIRVVTGSTFAQQQDHLRMLLLTLLAPGCTVAWNKVTQIEERASGKAAYYLNEYRV